MPSPSTGNKRASGRVACLCSGGLDSSVMLVELAKNYSEVTPLYVSCGLAWEEAETRFLERFLKVQELPSIRPVQVLDFNMRDVYGSAWYTNGRDVPGYDEADEKWEIPGRNLLLLSKAAVWAALHRVEEIALGVLVSNPFPDASPRFFHGLQAALSLGLGARIAILRPLGSFHKEEVVRLGADLPLELTLSCASPAEESHCGRCGKCRERSQAFATAKISDPTCYATEPGPVTVGETRHCSEFGDKPGIG
jgi:7-cyano-7-deazaguanine synthase